MMYTFYMTLFVQFTRTKWLPIEWNIWYDC